jgi:hypothetical protein
VWTWGRGDSGELGNLRDVVAISAGDLHSLALLKDGTVRAWGQNRYGQIGDGTSTNRDTPTTVPGVRNVVAIAAGGYREREGVVEALRRESMRRWRLRADGGAHCENAGRRDNSANPDKHEAARQA